MSNTPPVKDGPRVNEGITTASVRPVSYTHLTLPTNSEG